MVNFLMMKKTFRKIHPKEFTLKEKSPERIHSKKFTKLFSLPTNTHCNVPEISLSPQTTVILLKHFPKE